MRLRKILAEQEGLDYYVFNTRYAGYEKELIRKIYKFFKDEPMRIYCCGGSGTMRNILSGLDRQKLDNIEIAFYPCGLTNDFLRVFGPEQERFRNLEELLRGEILRVDYIVTNHGIALNTISTGADTAVLYYLEKLRGVSVFGKRLPHMLSTFCGALFPPKIEYDIWIDNMHKKEFLCEACCSNGSTLGGNLQFASGCDPTDGKGVMTMISRQSGLKNLWVLNKLRKPEQKKTMKAVERKECYHIRICRSDGRALAINYDGEMVEGVHNLEARFVKKGLKLVVPKGVRPVGLQERGE